MADKIRPVDWSQNRYKQLLIEQRKFMWRDDTIDKLAKWLGLSPGMTAIDIGCGLGYLGYTWWPYFGKRGYYIGIDKSPQLLRDAKQASTIWAKGGKARFINSDAYKLPISDNSADLVMCQVVLMHLVHPQKALAEMVRVARPGGLVLCVEPDNLSSMLAKRNWSFSDQSIEMFLLDFKISLIANKGRIKLGLGDNNIGVQIPHMMSELALIDIDARINDEVWFIEPPYKGEKQQYRFKMLKRNMLDDKHTKFFKEQERKEFIAGGGVVKEFEKYYKIVDKLKPKIKKQFKEGKLFSCGSHDFYIIKGRKPK